MPKETDSNDKEQPSQKTKDLDRSMMELFREELETQSSRLNTGLISLEETKNPEVIQELMRASHSIKGAARIIGLKAIERLAHAMEDYMSAIQMGKLDIQSEHITALLKAVDLFTELSKTKSSNFQEKVYGSEKIIEKLIEQIQSAIQKREPAKEVLQTAKSESPPAEQLESAEDYSDRIIRVTALHLNRLMGLAGESLVESRWLQPFSESLIKIKRPINKLMETMDTLRGRLDEASVRSGLDILVAEIQKQTKEIRDSISDRIAELDMFILRNSSLSDRLYREVIDSRMRPFSDGIQGFPRMVRDLAKELNKRVRLEIFGHSTPVDREILERLKSPLNHIIRNAIDHGLETEEERIKAGKPPVGLIKLEAEHRGGMLAITITDDGRGIDTESLRETIVARKIVPTEIAENLRSGELLEFLFLPGFTTSEKVTQISGRGIGLSVVQNMIQEVNGTVKAESAPGKGTIFHLELPLTLSIIRVLIANVGGEPYAFPLARLARVVLIPNQQIKVVENKQFFQLEEQNVGIVSARQVFGFQENYLEDVIPIILIGGKETLCGVVVDDIIGEKELVVHELDPRLGKIQDISSAALMEDGSPVLIVDIEDMLNSINAILVEGRLHKVHYAVASKLKEKKKILVIDDSITVREVEARLLRNHGYNVQLAVNGVDGWNALKMSPFDLVLTDLDMPRLSGIELIRKIRDDPKLKDLPVMVVSYKEREEDRSNSMAAGANYYLAKSNFHEETLINSVETLIGKP